MSRKNAKKLNYLVTGANGFIGRWLCSDLIKKGFSVRGTVRNFKKSNLINNIEKYETGPINGSTSWCEVLDDIDAVIHLAARVHVLNETSSESLREFRSINTEGTKKLALDAAQAGVRRLVYLSTIKVNGEKTTTTPFKEKDKPNPQDFYSISKYEAELILQEISESTGLEVTIVRPPLVYGPGVGANFLRLIKLVKSGVPLPFARIRNLRSIIYVRNLTDAIISLIPDPNAIGQTYLVSDIKDISTPDLICQIASALGKTSLNWPMPVILLKFAGMLINKYQELRRLTDSLQLDSEKIRNDIGWTPPYSLTEGLKETVEWFIGELN